MQSDFLHPDIVRFIERRAAWQRFFDLRGDVTVDVDDEVQTFARILSSAADVCADIAAGARSRWNDAARLDGGQVVVPAHVVAGYEKLRRAGLLCPSLGQAYGGLGLPFLLNTAILEMLARADPSLMTIVGLQAGVATDIERYGDEETKDRYLPRFASGELQGAMGLTEPGAGSDLGGIRTRVSSVGERLVVNGEKIFITNGGSGVHLVLARDAATFERTRGTLNGLSLVLCPAILPDGRRNSIQVTRVEEKLGLHGSPTCVVLLDHAEGILLGQAGGGFRAMLDLMNLARLGVAAQAVGIAEGAYQAARAYAGDRVQFGRALVHHPLMTAMLAEMRVSIQAARALLYRTATMVDEIEALRVYLRSERGRADPRAATLRREHLLRTRLVRVLTSLSKYTAGEMSHRVTRTAMQVHGGLGYLADAAVGHAHLDSLITTIYEGTSEIQLTFSASELARGVLDNVIESIDADMATAGAAHPELAASVARGVRWLDTAVRPILADQDLAQHKAEYIGQMVSDVVIGAELLRQASHDPAALDRATAFIEQRMPVVEMQARQLGASSVATVARCARMIDA